MANETKIVSTTPVIDTEVGHTKIMGIQPVITKPAAAAAAPFLPFYPKRNNVLLRM